MTDSQNSFPSFQPYLVYCRYTDEKDKLLDTIREEIVPLKVDKVLDIGSGNGTVTASLADLVSPVPVDAVERSPSQARYAVNHNSRPNITYHNTPFESFRTNTRYEFILASHVLQYIDSGLEGFIRKATSHLATGGQLWVIQQTRVGMAQIIAHQLQYLANPRFASWKTFEDYEPLMRETVNDGYSTKTTILDTSFEDINFSDPSEDDKLRLEFIFCLDKPFDEQSDQFKAHLGKLTLGKNNRIAHPNGIVKISRTH